jgi:hypothetical protein
VIGHNDVQTHLTIDQLNFDIRHATLLLLRIACLILPWATLKVLGLRGQAYPSEVHDRGHGLHRTGADSVGGGNGLGRDEADRGAPLIGGVFTSFLLELLVYPARSTSCGSGASS